MSSKALSPTASILRSSRLFSLPPPIPKPAPELTLGVSFNSDTATTQYPTQATIVTTQSARSRGDWGLKRPLPLRSTTKTSTPVVRVHAVDSPQHITDFSSASDHVLTLQKWRELNLSLSTLSTFKTRQPNTHPKESISRTSVFESEVDRTLEEPRMTSQADAGRRWKFAGPWLAGQTQGEFERYLGRRVRARRREFKEFLRQYLKSGKVADGRHVAREAGRVDGDASAVEVSDQEVEAKLKSLRQDPLLVELDKLVRSFLDLPTLPDSSGENAAYDETGPPKTHPSGGLSYLRTHAVLSNHPLLGPQAKSAPVEARILTPRQSTSGHGSTAKLGVAGVVTDDTTHVTFNESANGQHSGLKTWDTTTSGGGKTWVHPNRAAIDAHGQIKLLFEMTESGIVDIYKGQSKGDGAEGGTRPSIPASERRSEADIISSLPSTSKRGYGLENTSELRKRDSQAMTPLSEQALRTTYKALEDIGSRSS